MQLATYKSMLTKASNDLVKSKQLVGLLKQQIEQGNTELSEELDKANGRISMLSEDLSDANARIYVLEVALTQAESDNSELRAEVSRLHSKADDYEKANALLDIADKAQVDYKTIIEVLLHRKFAHNSDMTKLLNGVLDTSDAEVNELGLDGLKKKISDAADEALDEKHKEGSRSHSVQEDAIFKDSCIRVFTADRAVLYVTIEKDLEEMGLVRTACWFYARHRFVDAYISDHRVRVIILMMNYLFQIERESKIRKHTAKQRRRFRLKYSASIVGKLMKLLKKIKLDSSYGAMVQRAVNYVLDDEKAFKVFLQDGRVEMHNNAVERMFRHLALGRRNWMHTGSHLGAENIAFMFSLFESCKLNDINFGVYIEDILTRLMEGEQDFMSLIPCNYNSNKKVNVKAA